jgi:elongation factor Ts
MISTEQVKELRDQTGISIMQCKKALEEAKGDFQNALILLKKKGADVAGKKTDRVFKAGVISSYIHVTGSVGTMVELRCETDFVSRNDEFKQMAYDIAMHVAATNPEYLSSSDIPEEAKIAAGKAFEEEVKGKPEAMKAKILEGKISAYFKDRVLLDQPFIKNDTLTINELIQSGIQKFGEKIEIARYARFTVLGS